MLFTIREIMKKQATGKSTFIELEEQDFAKMPIVGDLVIVNRKNYRVDAVVIGNELKSVDPNGKVSEGSKENFLNVSLTSRNYKNNRVKEVARHDRYGHEIISVKGGGEYTQDNGKKIREWDREGKLIFGKPYPSIARAGDGI